MPIVMVHPDDGGRHPVPRYQANLGPDFGEVGTAAIRGLRKSAAADREFFAGARDRCGRNDPAGARWASGEAKANARMERACTLVLRWIEGEPDATYPRQWPVEMADDLDRALISAYLAEAQHQDGLMAIRDLCSPMGRC